MKFICLAYYDEKAFKALPKAEVEAIVSQCPAYDQALRETGALLVQASLGKPAESVSIRPRQGKVEVTDGPFAEAKELVGGFFMIEAEDMDAAVVIASKHPAAHLGEHIGWGIEVRPVGYCAGP